MELTQLAREALEKHKGRDVVLLDVRKLSNVTDYYLMATGTSVPHIKALTDEVTVALKKRDVRCYGKSGTPDSQWVALDFIDLVVHVFSAETRAYYALEELWSDAERVG